MRLALTVPAPGIKRVVHHHAVLEPAKFCDRPSDSAYRPADCSVRSSREVSAPRTMTAICCKAVSSSAYL